MPIQYADIFALTKTKSKDNAVLFSLQHVGHLNGIVTQVSNERADYDKLGTY